MIIKVAKGNHKTINKVKRLYKDAIKDNQAKISMRLQGILFSLQGKNAPEISKILNVHRSTVNLWIEHWNKYNEYGLLEGQRSGRPTKLNLSDLEKISDIIESGPVAYGLDTGVWTSIIISSIIEDEFNIKYHPGHIRKLLKSLGFSQQRPLIKIYKADKQKQNKWIRYDYPKLKKNKKMKTQ